MNLANTHGQRRSWPITSCALAAGLLGAAIGALRYTQGQPAPYQPSQRLPLATTMQDGPGTLRAAGKKRGVLIGAAVLANEYTYPDPLTTEPAYVATLTTQFAMVEPETVMKWAALHPQPTRYDFGPADELVRLATEHHMSVRGHTLCWGVANPAWLDPYKQAKPAMIAQLLHDHIRTVVGHFRGKVFAWDVVNEALRDPGILPGDPLQDSIWYNQPGIGQPGVGYIDQAFRWAHEADPDALLFYNENDVLVPGRKFDAMYRMLSGMLARGVPVNGVGLQLHLGINGYPNTEGFLSNLRRLAALGLQVHMTEVDVAVPVDSRGNASAADLQQQADTYARILEICLKVSACTAFQTWGFTDKHSWIPEAHPGQGAALLFDDQYRPKPAFLRILDTLSATRGAK